MGRVVYRSQMFVVNLPEEVNKEQTPNVPFCGKRDGTVLGASLIPAVCLRATLHPAFQSSTQDEYPEALAMLEKALKIRVEKLGLNHPNTIITLNNLVAVLEKVSRTLQ